MKSESLLVQTEGDAVLCAKRAFDRARDAGFHKQAQWEIAISVSELATNIVKFAGRGTIAIESFPRGLRVIAADSGPGIADVARAFEDGYSTGGLGLGLGTVRRLMNEVTVDSGVQGTRIVAEKWLR